MEGKIMIESYLDAIERAGSHLLVALLDLRNEFNLSLRCIEGGVEDPFLFRCQRRARLLAEALIADHGKWNSDVLKNVIKLLEEGPYFFFPFSPEEPKWSMHALKVLKAFDQDQVLARQFQRFRLPLCHKKAEIWVRAAAHVSNQAPLNDAALKRAVLSSCLTILRQSVGSCFASAPAIMIHLENLPLYLTDLEEILMTGRLTRTFGGVLYAVPMGLNTGWGNLKIQAPSQEGLIVSPSFPSNPGRGRTPLEVIESITIDPERALELQEFFKAGTIHPLLKIWEYTLASFSDVKMAVSNWNLYSSLGFDPGEEGGVGAVIYGYVEERLNEANREYEKAHILAEKAFHELKLAEHLMKAGGQTDARRVQMQYTAAAYHLRSCLELRDGHAEKGKYYAQLFSYLVRGYTKNISEYFQEIYDAQIEGDRASIFDDSPAGFRLVYKHGRSETLAWTPIRDAEQWERILVDFFRAQENEISGESDSPHIAQDLFEVTSRLIQHVRSSKFVSSAVERSRKRADSYGFPWAYVSGGTMDTLVQCYFRQDRTMFKEEKSIESGEELSTFILDTVKHSSESYEKGDKRALLMQSPTHAFLLYPGLSPLHHGTESDLFSYSWIRDQIVLPAREFYRGLRLSYEEQIAFVNKVPWLSASYFSHNPVSLTAFSDQLSLSNLDEKVALFYEHLPLYPIKESIPLIRKLVDVELAQIPQFSETHLSGKEICEVVLSIMVRQKRSIFFTEDPYALVVERARKKGVLPFTPFLFADTNWPHFFFGMAVNPMNGHFELWRMDSVGLSGMPMTTWQPWLDGSHRIPWIIYARREQYGYA